MKLRAIKRVLFIAPALLLGVQSHAAPIHLLCEETWGENRFFLNKESDEDHVFSPVKDFRVHQVSIDTNTASYMGKKYLYMKKEFLDRRFRLTPKYIVLIGSFNGPSRPINWDPKERLLFIIDRSTLRFSWNFLNQGDWGEWWYERQGQCKTKRGPNASGRRVRQNHRFERLKI